MSSVPQQQGQEEESQEVQVQEHSVSCSQDSGRVGGPCQLRPGGQLPVLPHQDRAAVPPRDLQVHQMQWHRQHQLLSQRSILCLRTSWTWVLFLSVSNQPLTLKAPGCALNCYKTVRRHSSCLIFNSSYFVTMISSQKWNFFDRIFYLPGSTQHSGVNHCLYLLLNLLAFAIFNLWCNFIIFLHC